MCVANRWLAWGVVCGGLMGLLGNFACYASFDGGKHEERDSPLACKVIASSVERDSLEASLVTSQDAASEDIVCGICRDILVSAHTIGVMCGGGSRVHHRYHVGCLNGWIERQTQSGMSVCCPLCRAPLAREIVAMTYAWADNTQKRCECEGRQAIDNGIVENEDGDQGVDEQWEIRVDGQSWEDSARSMLASVLTNVWSNEAFVILAFVVALSAK